MNPKHTPHLSTVPAVHQPEKSIKQQEQSIMYNIFKDTFGKPLKNMEPTTYVVRPHVAHDQDGKRQ